MFKKQEKSIARFVAIFSFMAFFAMILACTSSKSESNPEVPSSDIHAINVVDSIPTNSQDMALK